VDGRQLSDSGRDDRFWVSPPRGHASFQDVPVALRLFCFPHAGAGGGIFLEWGGRLPRHVQVVGAHLPGRGTRTGEVPLDSVARIVAALSRAIGRWDGVPSVFFGHSFGGIVAYELARALVREGRAAPEALMVSSCPAPCVPPRRPFLVHTLPRRAFFEELTRLNGLSARDLGNEKLLELIEPALRADIKARELWSLEVRSQPPPSDPLDIPIHPLGGAADPFVSPDDLARWRAYTTDLRPTVLFEGGHFYFADALDAVTVEITRIVNLYCGGRS
jgi:medium-chain acyl-[acyl-carrier-protein] hydrolase